jgi:hypothetical protein
MAVVEPLLVPEASPFPCREEWTTAIQTVADGLKRQEEEPVRLAQ